MGNQKPNHLKTSRPTPFSRFAMRLDEICSPQRLVNPAVLRRVIELAIEISREGREGRKIGTMFVVGDESKVMAASSCLILDPLQGHSTQVKYIDDPNMRETVKELAQLDGAFVVSNDGVFLSAARYINANSQDIDLPLGLGSRHIAGASITLQTDAVAVVVSESSVVRIMDDGKMIAEIIPELWLIQRARSHIPASQTENKKAGTAAKTKDRNRSSSGQRNKN